MSNNNLVVADQEDYIVSDVSKFKAAVQQYLLGKCKPAASAFIALNPAPLEDLKTADLLQKKWLATTYLQRNVFNLEKALEEQRWRVQLAQNLYGTNILSASVPLGVHRRANLPIKAPRSLVTCLNGFEGFLIADESTLNYFDFGDNNRLSLRKSIPLSLTALGLALSVDSHHAVIAFKDRLEVMDLAINQIDTVHKFHHTGIITMKTLPLKASGDAFILVVLAKNGMITLLYPLSDRPLHTYECPGAKCMTALPATDQNPLLIIVGMEKGKISRLRPSDTIGKIVKAHEVSVDCLASHHLQPHLFVSGGRDNLIKVWTALDLECIRQLSGHSDWVTALTFHPDGQILVSGSGDNALRVWKVDTGECIKVIDAAHETGCTDLLFDSSGRRLLSWSAQRSPYVWDCNTLDSTETPPSSARLDLDVKAFDVLSDIHFSPIPSSQLTTTSTAYEPISLPAHHPTFACGSLPHEQVEELPSPSMTNRDLVPGKAQQQVRERPIVTKDEATCPRKGMPIRDGPNYNRCDLPSRAHALTAEKLAFKGSDFSVGTSEKSVPTFSQEPPDTHRARHTEQHHPVATTVPSDVQKSDRSKSSRPAEISGRNTQPVVDAKPQVHERHAGKGSLFHEASHPAKTTFDKPIAQARSHESTKATGDKGHTATKGSIPFKDHRNNTETKSQQETSRTENGTDNGNRLGMTERAKPATHVGDAAAQKLAGAKGVKISTDANLAKASTKIPKLQGVDKAKGGRRSSIDNKFSAAISPSNVTKSCKGPDTSRPQSARSTPRKSSPQQASSGTIEQEFYTPAPISSEMDNSENVQDLSANQTSTKQSAVTSEGITNCEEANAPGSQKASLVNSEHFVVPQSEAQPSGEEVPIPAKEGVTAHGDALSSRKPGAAADLKVEAPSGAKPEEKPRSRKSDAVPGGRLHEATRQQDGVKGKEENGVSGQPTIPSHPTILSHTSIPSHPTIASQHTTMKAQVRKPDDGSQNDAKMGGGHSSICKKMDVEEQVQVTDRSSHRTTARVSHLADAPRPPPPKSDGTLILEAMQRKPASESSSSTGGTTMKKRGPHPLPNGPCLSTGGVTGTSTGGVTSRDSKLHSDARRKVVTDPKAAAAKSTQPRRSTVASPTELNPKGFGTKNFARATARTKVAAAQPTTSRASAAAKRPTTSKNI